MGYSKRYYEQLKKIQTPKKEKKEMAKQYDNFNVEPGQSTWVDMPEDYKLAFYRHQEALQNAAARKRESQLVTQEKEQRLKERVQEMEKRLFTEKKFGKFVPEAVEEQPGIRVETRAKPPTAKKKKGLYMTQDASVSNFIDQKFFNLKHEEIIKTLDIKSGRPRILLISDVIGWAWWNKSHYLKSYLADDYAIEVISLVGPGGSSINKNRFALYVTYGYSYVFHLQGIHKDKRVTGMTAHRPLGTLRPYMQYAGHLHANSKMLLEDLKRIANPDKQTIHYVPNGVDEELFHPIKPIKEDGQLVVGHVGKKCPQKHQEDIILPAIKETGLKSVTNLADYTKKRPYCEMPEIYQDMDVFVVASDEDGTPNPALEAAACGRPIISNRIGNMPEFIKNGYNGYLIDDLDVKKYVQKLNHLNKNRDKLIEMGKNARKTVEESWTWKIQAENYRKMFKKILKK